jgi:UrcA family protein
MKLFLTRLARVAVPLVAICGLLPTLAFGNALDDTRSVRVRFADLDLNSPAGAERLYRRLSIAARDVCGDESEIIDLRQIADIHACRNEALEGAVAGVDRPLLTAAFERHHPGTVLVAESRTPRDVHVSVSYQ